MQNGSADKTTADPRPSEEIVQEVRSEWPDPMNRMPRPDLISELIALRAYMLHRASDIEAIAELPARKRGPEACRIAERIRAAVSAPHLVEACKRG